MIGFLEPSYRQSKEFKKVGLIGSFTEYQVCLLIVKLNYGLEYRENGLVGGYYEFEIEIYCKETCKHSRKNCCYAFAFAQKS